MAVNRSAQLKIPSWELFWSFCKVGCFTFGGGLVMLPLIRREVVENRGWLKDAEIIDSFAIAQSLPGAIAINTSIFIGRQLGGISGALMALLGVALPAFASILLVLLALTSLQENIYLERIFSGIKAAAAALIFLATWQLGQLVAKGILAGLIAFMSFLMIVVFDINAAWAIIFGALAGCLASQVAERRKG